MADLWVRRNEGPAHVAELPDGTRFPCDPVAPVWTICRRTINGTIESARYPVLLPHWWKVCRDCASLTGVSTTIIGGI